ncbi:hypothetical protein BS50DRAFT_387079 [Corynespora cassiicola Philippines]|uniref:Uncharacterized protein n=1 Tax=Corynespora cassiicola Philippines TaxID=1448308 RepID=A0A2T2NP91_CORCC|nr:hypothetical protein BS50DRAFT_387079 [Corynespora cassiicola Philippines]
MLCCCGTVPGVLVARRRSRAQYLRRAARGRVLPPSRDLATDHCTEVCSSSERLCYNCKPEPPRRPRTRRILTHCRQAARSRVQRMPSPPHHREYVDLLHAHRADGRLPRRRLAARALHRLPRGRHGTKFIVHVVLERRGSPVPSEYQTDW